MTRERGPSFRRSVTSHPPARQSTSDQTRSRTVPPVTTNKHPWARRNTPASTESCRRLPTNRDPNGAFWPPDLSANSVHQLVRLLSRSPVHTPERASTRSPACPVPVTPGFSSPPFQFLTSKTLHACLPACALGGSLSLVTVNTASIFGHVCMDPYTDHLSNETSTHLTMQGPVQLRPSDRRVLARGFPSLC